MKYNTVKKDFLLNKDLLKNFFYSFDLSGQNKIILDNVLYLTNNRYNEDFSSECFFTTYEVFEYHRLVAMVIDRSLIQEETPHESFLRAYSIFLDKYPDSNVVIVKNPLSIKDTTKVTTKNLYLFFIVTDHPVDIYYHWNER